MRKDRSHLRLVGSGSLQPSITAVGGEKVITVHVDNVEPGQICEILHNGMLSLSHRVVVGENMTSITIPTFSLKHGEYNVSLRLDGRLDCVTESQTAIVGSESDLTSRVG